MDREELVQQILKQVLAKLTDMGEKADAACVRPDAVCPAAHKPGLLILTQEHGVDCHAKLEDPRLQERYGTPDVYQRQAYRRYARTGRTGASAARGKAQICGP